MLPLATVFLIYFISFQKNANHRSSNSSRTASPKTQPHHYTNGHVGNGYTNGGVTVTTISNVGGVGGTVSQRGSVASRSSAGSNGGSPQHKILNNRKRISPVNGAHKDSSSNSGSSPDDGGLVVTIKMKPDEQGRFGFNVKVVISLPIIFFILS